MPDLKPGDNLIRRMAIERGILPAALLRDPEWTGRESNDV